MRNRTAPFAFFIGALILAPSAGARAACENPAAVATTRATAETTCSCATATNHGSYVRCVKGVARDAVDAQTLPRNCKGDVVKCAAKSTCGKPGFVTCCKTKSNGKTTCSVKKNATACKAPKGGSACVATASSCCDACVEGGCSATTTSTSTSSTTTAPPTTSSSTTTSTTSTTSTTVGSPSGAFLGS